ncbi:pyrroloquinoline quinone biosynthesis peptide chaperone PqqD [Streptomyces sp. NPDC006446]|uniref:pyrroloquinoline quinone biosynthesis peptide chaperone PqqD n=1 Tax=Streptomyces sp. NPDC006446 TaxID=3154301 RepID=UPI0033B52651
MSGDAAWRPRLPASALLRHDRTRDAEVLLLPERVVVLHGSGRAVLELCDGVRTVDEVITRLTAEHPEHVESADVVSFLGRLRKEGCLR